MLSLHWILHLYLPSRMQKVKNQEKGRLQLVMSVRLIVLSAARTTGSSVKLGSDGVRDVGQLLLLLLKVFGGG